MTDGLMKALLVAAMAALSTGLGLGFTSLGWRWPLIAAGSAVAAGTLLLIAIETRSADTFVRTVIGAAVAVLALAAWHGLSPAPAAVWLYRVAFAVEFLFMLAATIFAFTFKMNRLF
jgi:hypothetical protein